MSRHIGVDPNQLAGPHEIYGSVPFILAVTTVAGTSSYNVFNSPGAPKRVTVLDVWARAYGGAGGAGDTVTVTDKDGNAISAALNLNIADNTIARTTTIDDAYQTINVGDQMLVATASGAVAFVYILCVWAE